MGIDAYWKSESGAVLGTLSDSHMLLARFASSRAILQHGVCLRFLDPCGDACFNQMQIPVLVQELRNALLNVAEPKLRAHLEGLALFVERAVETHTYLWFVGD